MDEIRDPNLAIFNDVLSKQLPTLYSIWDEVGYSNDERQRKITRSAEWVSNVIAKFIREENKSRDGLLEEVEKLGAEFLTMKSDLEMVLPEPSDHLSILELRVFLEAQREVLLKAKAVRLNEYDALQREDKTWSDKLGTQLKELSFPIAPSKEQLEEYRNYIATQKEELGKRMSVFHKIRPIIIEVMNDLDLIVENDFQQAIVIGENFKFSEDNMTELETLCHKLEDDLKRNKNKVEKLKKELLGIWAFLQVSPDEQTSFLKKFSGYRSNVIIMFKKELARCYELKLANIEKFVNSIRDEIRKYWDMTFIKDEDRAKFNAFDSEDFTEELLIIHEDEFKRLKQEYENGKEIFLAFKNRLDLWKKMKELEVKANDPKRLNNRGGKLLAEEKERVKLQNHIPKLEQRLIEMVGEWESRHNRQFLVFGQTVTDYIKEQWERREQEKENEKLERRAKNHQMMEDLLNGNRTGLGSCKRPREAGATPYRAAGPKLAKTVLTPLTTFTNNQMSVYGKPPPSTSKVNVLATPADQKKGKLKPARLFCKKRSLKSKLAGRLPLASQVAGDETNPFSISIESTSSEFQKNLLKKAKEDKYCRSSAAPVPLTPSRTQTTPNRFRDRLGLPFIL